MTKISGELLISGQFQDNCEISGISGQLGALSIVVEFAAIINFSVHLLTVTVIVVVVTSASTRC